jgi:hypothetical protein
LHGFRIAHIDWRNTHGTSCGAQAGSRSLEGFALPAREDDVRAKPREQLADSESDPTPTARHDRYLARQEARSKDRRRSISLAARRSRRTHTGK